MPYTHGVAVGWFVIGPPGRGWIGGRLSIRSLVRDEDMRQDHAWGEIRMFTMAHSLVKNLIHLVFSTQYRRRWLIDSVQSPLFAYLAGTFRKLDSPAIIVNGVEDHVHALFSLSKRHALMDVIEEVKKSSSKWMKSDGSRNPHFHWQRGYAAFSVSSSMVETVRRYIQNQHEHHRQMTFQEELQLLLERHRIEYNERYFLE